jgi:hypothetical protein
MKPMRSPCCLSVYPSLSVHLSVHPLLMFGAPETYEVNLLSACLRLPPPKYLGFLRGPCRIKGK